MAAADSFVGEGLNESPWKEAVRERNALADALEEIREFLDGYVDIVDGDDGQPKPNMAMRVTMMIDAALAAQGE